MRDRKSLTSSEPSASVVTGIVRYLFFAFYERVSIYMYSAGTEYSAEQDFAGRGGKDSGEREARDELQRQSRQWENEKKKTPYTKTRAAPTTRIDSRCNRTEGYRSSIRRGLRAYRACLL